MNFFQSPLKDEHHIPKVFRDDPTYISHFFILNIGLCATRPNGIETVNPIYNQSGDL